MSNNLILKNIFLINFFHINETFSFNSYSLHNTYTIHKERIKSKPEYSPYKTIYAKISLHFSNFFFFFPNPQNTSRTRSHEKLISSFLNTFRVTVLKISDVCSAISKKGKMYELKDGRVRSHCNVFPGKVLLYQL